MTITALTITGIALMSALTAQGAFVISQPNGDAFTGDRSRGFAFTPSVGMVDDPGPSTTTIDLTAISFWSGGVTTATTSDTSYLLIFSAKPSTTSGSSVGLVGSSTNFFDLNPISNAPNGTQLTWTFNNLTLDYDTTYYAVFSSSNSATSAFGMRMQVANTSNPYTGGGALDVSYNIVTNQDYRFAATFTNPVPEPSAAILGSLGMLALLRRRRD
jgi:hypothetical protein